MPRELPADVLTVIFSLCQNPVPPPLSKPPRASLRQPNLASFALVCKLWQEVAEALLYGIVVTDDFASLLVNTHPSSSHRPLLHTRTLYLDYAPPGLEASYESLLQHGGFAWTLCGRRSKDIKEDPMLLTECWLEAERLKLALTRANTLGMKNVFPRLERIAVQSFYASADTWDRFNGNKYTNDGSRIYLPAPPVIELFHTFLLSGNLKHLCFRSSLGPLTLPWISYASDRPISFTTTVHFGSYATEHLPLPLGSKVRWVFEGRRNEDWAHVLLDFEWCVLQLVGHRAQDAQKRGSRPDVADIEVYCNTSRLDPGAFNPELDQLNIAKASGITPTDWRFAYSFSDDPRASPHTMTAPQLQRIIAHLNKEVQWRFQSKSGLKDSIKWRMTKDTPVCESCSLGVPSVQQIDTVFARPRR